MKKNNIIKKNEDYNRILHNTVPIHGQFYSLYIEMNKSNEYHFGFSVGKKLCCAVDRNKIKRQTKSILDKREYINGFNCVILARKAIINKTFNEKQEDLFKLIDKAKIVKGEK